MGWRNIRLTPEQKKQREIRLRIMRWARRLYGPPKSSGRARSN